MTAHTWRLGNCNPRVHRSIRKLDKTSFSPALTDPRVVISLYLLGSYSYTTNNCNIVLWTSPQRQYVNVVATSKRRCCNVLCLLGSHFILQVCFNGVNEANGKCVEKTFNETYGPNSALFVKCDVSKEAEFEG